MQYEHLTTAFDLTAKLLEAKTFQELNSAIIKLISDLESIADVSVYELLGRIEAGADEQDLLIRKFPLSLVEDFVDHNYEIINFICRDVEEGVSTFTYDEQDYTYVYCTDNESPAKLIVIKGKTSPFEFEVIKGLAKVYKYQTELFQSKERDSLTKLNNRQTLENTIKQLRQFYSNPDNASTEVTSWLAIFDIDKFKSINDQYGHLYGDEVLIHFSNLMMNNFRHTDFLFRYGGDEFLAIVNTTEKTGMHKVLERFRSKVESYNFPSGNVTTSIGCTEITAHKSMADLLDIADAALYKSKENGRNCVTYLDENPHSTFNDDIELF